jgi:two-component system OmpR family response regulator
MQKHILVVDDDPEIRTLIAEYLERNGFRASTLPDGRDLMRTIEERAVDLLVLDLMMPGVDGLTLCRELRSRSRLPVLILSARGEDVDRIVGLEMGADDYLAKPFHPRELLARIRAILARSTPAEPAAEAEEFRFDQFRLDMVRRELTRGTARRCRSPARNSSCSRSSSRGPIACSRAIRWSSSRRGARRPRTTAASTCA